MSLSISIDKSNFHQLVSIRKLLKDLLKNLNEIVHQQTQLIEYLDHHHHSLDQCKQILDNYFEEINRNELIIDEIVEQYRCLTLKSNEIIKYEINLRKETSFYPNLTNVKMYLKNISIKDRCLLSTNDEYLLVHTNQQLHLFDRNYRLRTKIRLNEIIHDICWSTQLNKFFLVSSKDLFEFNVNSILLKCVRLTYKSQGHWNRLCFSHKYLFISQSEVNSDLYQFDLFPTIQLSKKLKKEIYSNANQFINDLKYFDRKVYLLIEDNSTNECFIQIYLLKTFELEKKLCLGFGWNYRLTLFNNEYWIISDNYNQRCIYFDVNGQILKIDKLSLKINEIVGWFHQQLIIESDHNISIYQSL